MIKPKVKVIKKIAKPVRIVEKAKFFTSPMVEKGDNVIITLPKGILKHINGTQKSVFWTVLNGVVQISGNKPYSVIPMLSLTDFTEKQD